MKKFPAAPYLSIFHRGLLFGVGIALGFFVSVVGAVSLTSALKNWNSGDTLTASDINAAFNTIKSTLESIPSPNAPCAAGFTRVSPSFCADSDGSPTIIRSTTSDDAAYVTSTLTTIPTTARAVLVRANARLSQDASAEFQDLNACIIPGDSSVTTCDSLVAAAWLQVRAATETDTSNGTIIVASPNREVKTRCTGGFSGASLNSIGCFFTLHGYFD